MGRLPTLLPVKCSCIELVMKPRTASCIETSTFWPSPVRSRACRAARMPSAMLTPAASSPTPSVFVPRAPLFFHALCVHPAMLFLLAAVLPQLPYVAHSPQPRDHSQISPSL